MQKNRKAKQYDQGVRDEQAGFMAADMESNEMSAGDTARAIVKLSNGEGALQKFAKFWLMHDAIRDLLTYLAVTSDNKRTIERAQAMICKLDELK